MQWRMQLTKKCGYCAVTFPTTISGRRLTVRPPELLIRARGRTGIPKWVATPHRRDPYDGSETSWDRINWILCKLMEIPIPCGDLASLEEERRNASIAWQKMRQQESSTTSLDEIRRRAREDWRTKYGPGGKT